MKCRLFWLESALSSLNFGNQVDENECVFQIRLNSCVLLCAAGWWWWGSKKGGVAWGCASARAGRPWRWAGRQRLYWKALRCWSSCLRRSTFSAPKRCDNSSKMVSTPIVLFDSTLTHKKDYCHIINNFKKLLVTCTYHLLNTLYINIHIVMFLSTYTVKNLMCVLAMKRPIPRESCTLFSRESCYWLIVLNICGSNEQGNQCNLSKLSYLPRHHWGWL